MAMGLFRPLSSERPRARCSSAASPKIRTCFEGDFAKLDTNKDGQLSKVEFMVAAPRAPATAPNGAKIVTQLDRNKDGKVSGDEYRAPIVARFDALDKNRDGVINPSERQAAATPRNN